MKKILFIIELEYSHITMTSTSLVILRDLAGDYWRDEKMFESKDTNLNIKIIEVTDGNV